MTMQITIPEQDLDDLRAGAQQAVRDAGLVEILGGLDTGPYGMTRVVLGALEAIEIGVAAMVAGGAAVRGRIVADRRSGLAGGELTEVEQRFVSLLACNLLSREALASLELEAGQLPPPDRHLKLEEYRALLTGGEDDLVGAVLRDLVGYIGFYTKHPKEAMRPEGAERLRACVGSYLALLGATARRLADDGEYASTIEGLREAGLSINGAVYRGFERETALPVQEDAGLLPVMPSDIVGNTDVLQAGLALARAVAGFDLDRGENPRLIRNPVLFVLGAPGCGKTVTAHAVGNYFLDLCKQNGVPARFRIIRRTDWASHYQNKSANELLRIFRQEIFEFPGVAGVYWPDIDTAFAAREDPGIRAEEKAVLGTLFGLLDGTVGPKNGKWFLIADANFLTMDEATLSRLSQDPHHAKGPESSEHFVELLRDKKLGHVLDHVKVDDDQWADIGKRCVDAGLSGRAIDNIAGKILGDMENIDVPDSYFALGFDEKVELLASRRLSFGYDDICQLLERYVKFEREADDRARAERFARRVTEIREQLAARVAAVGGGE